MKIAIEREWIINHGPMSQLAKVEGFLHKHGARNVGNAVVTQTTNLHTQCVEYRVAFDSAAWTGRT